MSVLVAWVAPSWAVIVSNCVRLSLDARQPTPCHHQQQQTDDDHQHERRAKRMTAAGRASGGIASAKGGGENGTHAAAGWHTDLEDHASARCGPHRF
jgi:hypothetical protein